MDPAGGYRDFPGKGWVVNGLRATHLIGVVGVGAGVLTALPFPAWQHYAVLLLASGTAILALDWWSNFRYVFQVNGLSVFAKLGLMAWFAWRPEHREALFWTILAGSVLIAHAPGKLRHRTLWRSAARKR